MRTVKVKNKEELEMLYDGKIYGICDHCGNYLFDVLEEDYIQMTDASIIDEVTYCFRKSISRRLLRNFRMMYGVEFIFTDDYDIKKMLLNSIISSVKEYCRCVGDIDDKGDDIHLHYMKPHAQGKMLLGGHGKAEIVFLDKIGYDENGAMPDKGVSGVLVFSRQAETGSPYVYNAEELSLEEWMEIANTL